MPFRSIAALQLLLQRSEADRDTARAVLQQAETQVRRARAQADQLTDYRSQFEQRWTAHFRQPGAATLLQCRRDFGERLDHAISFQTDEADHLGNAVERARGVLIERERRVASVRKLIERRQHELQRQGQRREQHSSDEHAQRVHASADAAQPPVFGDPVPAHER